MDEQGQHLQGLKGEAGRRVGVLAGAWGGPEMQQAGTEEKVFDLLEERYPAQEKVDTIVERLLRSMNPPRL